MCRCSVLGSSHAQPGPRQEPGGVRRRRSISRSSIVDAYPVPQEPPANGKPSPAQKKEEGAGVKDEKLSDSLLGQDHYAVLNLSHLRWKATEEDIRRACALRPSCLAPLGGHTRACDQTGHWIHTETHDTCTHSRATAQRRCVGRSILSSIAFSPAENKTTKRPAPIPPRTIQAVDAAHLRERSRPSWSLRRSEARASVSSGQAGGGGRRGDG